MTDQDEKKIEQDERPMTVKKKTQKEKQRVGQKTDEEEKKRKCIFVQVMLKRNRDHRRRKY